MINYIPQFYATLIITFHCPKFIAGIQYVKGYGLSDVLKTIQLYHHSLTHWPLLVGYLTEILDEY